MSNYEPCFMGRVYDRSVHDIVCVFDKDVRARSTYIEWTVEESNGAYGSSEISTSRFRVSPRAALEMAALLTKAAHNAELLMAAAGEACSDFQADYDEMGDEKNKKKVWEDFEKNWVEVEFGRTLTNVLNE